MKKSRRNIQTPDPDRLSELPDSLIFCIFALLPMRDVVATSVLAKRWRNLWTATPYLNFADFGSGDADFITWTLMFWRGTRILKLKIDSNHSFQPYLYSHIDLWIRFAKDYDVQELYLVPPEFNEEQYIVPSFLFSSCPSLKVLTLVSCNLNNQVQTAVRWDQLKRLDIYSDDGLTHDAVNRILVGSPQLEVLLLKFMESMEDLTIRSTSLKKLRVEKRGWVDEPLPDTRLVIWTPNLETLKINRGLYLHYSLENVSSLSRVSLRFDDVYGDDVLEQTLKQILSRIHHVGRLSLYQCCIKMLLLLKNKRMGPGLFYAKFLKLTSCFSDHRQVAGVLELFPRLEKLRLDDVNAFQKDFEQIIYFDFQPNLPNLRRIEINWTDCDERIFRLIEILLKHAGSLETMEFRVIKSDWYLTPPPEYLDTAIERLRGMERASATSNVFVCELFS